MYLKLIACNVLLREFCAEIAVSPHTFDIRFTEKGDHEDSTRLRGIIEKEIAESENSGKDYDAILLGFGLCGNSTAGLSSSRFPLVVPRAHDCCTLFLGSKERYREIFQDNPSKPFSSAGYMERGDFHMNSSETYKALGLHRTFEEYRELFGEENAEYIMKTLTPTREAGKEDEVLYIEIPETQFLGFADVCREEAARAGKRFSLIQGSTRIVRDLVSGSWDTKDFLYLKPCEKITPVYDWVNIFEASSRPQ